MNNKYWNPFDLHMHTLPGITGDAKRESASSIINFTFSNFINSLKDVGIKLFAITNHNYIHLDNYILCKYLSRKIGITSLLGVELDIDDSVNEHYHMVCIVDSNIPNLLNLSTFINNKSESSIGAVKKLRFDENDIGFLLSNYRVILIPHAPRKTPGISLNNQEEVEGLMKKVKDGYLCVLDERSNWDLGYLKNLIKESSFYKYAADIGSVFFSDNKDWSPGEYKKRLKHITCMNGEPSFKGLTHCLTNPTERFTFVEYIPSYSNYISKIIIKHKSDESFLKDSEVILKPGFNCVIGKSGSGKSLFIHLLEKYLSNHSIPTYAKYDNGGVEIHFFDENNREISPNTINFAIGQSIFNKLIEAIDVDDYNSLIRIIKILDPKYIQFSSFNTYKNNYVSLIQSFFDLKKEYKDTVNSIETSLNTFDGNYKIMQDYKGLNTVEIHKIPSKTDFALNEEEIVVIKNYKTHFDNLRKITSLLSKIQLDSNLLESTNELEKKYQTALNKLIYLKYKYSYYLKKIEIVSDALKSINGAISSNAKNKTSIEAYFRDNIPKVSSEIIKSIVLRNKLRNIDLSVDLEKMKMSGPINKDKSISIIEDIEDSIFQKAAFKDRKIYNTYGLSISDDKSYNLTKKTEAKIFFDNIYNSAKFEYKEDIASQKLFSDVQPSLTLLFDGQDVKTLNSGDIAKTYLKDYFGNQLGSGKSIVIYDQLENDVDKEFIKTDLLNFISDLKKRVQLIVVTHDPIIAVNGDPTNYIMAEKDNSKKIGYRSFVAESEERDELETLANTVDGSKEVIRERYRVYKGENI